MSPFMAILSVNIDHVATVRQARRTWEPDPIAAADEVAAGGAGGVTVHLREDRRHIQDADVMALAAGSPLPLNFEMAATDEMVEIACRIAPASAMLVPEGRAEITTEGGLDVAGQEAHLRDVVSRLSDQGIGASAFVDADLSQIEAAARCGFRVCEVHTGPWAHAVHDGGDTAAALEQVRQAGQAITELGMQFNAGHALHARNVTPVAALRDLGELHIGHSIVARAVFVGLRQATREMVDLIRSAAP